MNKLVIILLVFIFMCFASVEYSLAQQIQIDRGTRIGGLWCFPLLNDSLTYLYLPNSAALANDANNKPQFSFMRYVDNTATDGSTDKTITEAAGGAVLHFLVEYNTSKDTVTAAEKALRELFKNEKIVLRGPIIFNSGEYALVSSILNPDRTTKTSLLALGKAPVLEGSRIALSFEMTPENSKILMENFKMSTPDISLVFDMSFSGLTDAYSAELTIDWAEVKNSMSMGAGGSIYFVSADVKASFERLRRDNAIKLVTFGEDQNMDALLNTVYDKLLNLLFKPVSPEEVPQNQRGGLTDALAALVSSRGALGSRNTTGFGLNAEFQLKDMKSEGKSKLNFNSRATVLRHHYIVYNIGNFYKKYGNDENYFKSVNIFDPDFTQREVHVGIDGSLEPEFDKFINSVTVKLLKKHQNGEQTLQELFIDKNIFKNKTNQLKMVYGSVKDTDRLKWLEYEYQATWQFQKGGSYTGNWTPQGSSMINLFAPYERRTIELWGDQDILKQNQIRAVVVTLEYDFFNEKRKPKIIIKTSEPIENKGFEITQPLNVYNYKYSIDWIK
jgi:hypothetical protein